MEYNCVVCGKKFVASTNKKTCSVICGKIRKSQKDRESKGKRKKEISIYNREYAKNYKRTPEQIERNRKKSRERYHIKKKKAQ